MASPRMISFSLDREFTSGWEYTRFRLICYPQRLSRLDVDAKNNSDSRVIDP